MKVIILAGEDGTRLFPLARTDYPKQFLNIFGDRSLFMQSIMRFTPIASEEDIIVVTGSKYEQLVRNELAASGMTKVNIVLEPEFKSIFSATTLAINYCKNQLRCESDEIIFVSGSSHLISPVNAFLRNMKQGLTLTGKGKIVIFGIKPSKASVNHAYAKLGAKAAEGYLIDSFVEKPGSKEAETLFKEGYFWDAGISVFQLSTYYKELEKHAPEMFAMLNQPFPEMLKGYHKMPGKADDKLRETMDGLAMVILNCFWNAVGNWDDIYQVFDKDEESNVKQGDVLTIGCQDSLFIGEKRLIVGAGLSDVIVVETEDAILVSKRGKSDLVKDITGEIK